MKNATGNNSRQIIDSPEMARILHVSTRSLERYRGMGMPYFRLNHKKVLYDLDEVLQWIRQTTHTQRLAPRFNPRKDPETVVTTE